MHALARMPLSYDPANVREINALSLAGTLSLRNACVCFALLGCLHTLEVRGLLVAVRLEHISNALPLFQQTGLVLFSAGFLIGR